MTTNTDVTAGAEPATERSNGEVCEQILVRYIEVADEIIPAVKAARRRTLALLAAPGLSRGAGESLQRRLVELNGELAAAVALASTLAEHLHLIEPTPR